MDYSFLGIFIWLTLNFVDKEIAGANENRIDFLNGATREIPILNIVGNVKGQNEKIENVSSFDYQLKIMHNEISASTAYQVHITCFLPPFVILATVGADNLTWSIEDANNLHIKYPMIEIAEIKTISFRLKLANEHNLTTGLHFLTTSIDSYYYNTKVIEERNRIVNPMHVITYKFRIEGCMHDIGLDDHTLIRDYQFSASSSLIAHRAKDARMSNMGWCSGKKRKNQFLQIDFHKQLRISRIILVSRKEKLHWVKKFELRISEDGVHWKPFMMYGRIVELHGNTDSNKNTTIDISGPLDCHSLRIVPTAWQFKPCLRVAIYGCEMFDNTVNEGNCLSPLGIQNGLIKDEAFTDTNNFPISHPWRGRLHWLYDKAPFGWQPRFLRNIAQGSLQIDFGDITKIIRIDTQGGKQYEFDENNGFIKSFTLRSSNDSKQWFDHKGENQKNIVYLGPQTSSDALDPHTAHLQSPIIARYIQLVPVTYSVLPVLRMEVYGCSAVDEIATIDPNKTLQRRQILKVEDKIVVCSYVSDRTKTSCFLGTTDRVWKGFPPYIINIIGYNPGNKILFGVSREFSLYQSPDQGVNWFVISKQQFEADSDIVGIEKPLGIEDTFFGDAPTANTTLKEEKNATWGASSFGIHLKKTNDSQWQPMSRWR